MVLNSLNVYQTNCSLTISNSRESLHRAMLENVSKLQSPNKWGSPKELRQFISEWRSEKNRRYKNIQQNRCARFVVCHKSYASPLHWPTRKRHRQPEAHNSCSAKITTNKNRESRSSLFLTHQGFLFVCTFLLTAFHLKRSIINPIEIYRPFLETNNRARFLTRFPRPRSEGISLDWMTPLLSLLPLGESDCLPWWRE